MSFGTVVLLIVIASFIYGAWHRKTELEEQRLKHSARAAPEVERELAELRERIKVLERIATDGDTLAAHDTKRIAAEIDALRDEQNR